MAEQLLTISYRRRAEPPLRVEQVPWDDLVPAMEDFPSWLQTTYNLDADAMARNGQWTLLDSYQREYLSQCAAADGAFVAQVRVYRQPGQDYLVRLSHGSASAAEQHEEEFSEPVDVNQSDRVEMSGAIIQAVDWDADPYGQTGEVMPRPTVSISGQVARFGAKVALGRARVEAVRHYDLYRVTVPPRGTDDSGHRPGQRFEDGQWYSDPAATADGFTPDQENAELFTARDRYRATFMAFWTDASGEEHAVALDIDPPDLKNDPNAGGPGEDDGGDDGEEEESPRLVLVQAIDYSESEPVEVVGATIRVNGVVIDPEAPVVLYPGQLKALRITAPDIEDTDGDSLINNDTIGF